MSTKPVVATYSRIVPVGLLGVCAVLIRTVIKEPANSFVLITTIGLICLSVAILAYKAEVTSTEIRIRYLPLFSKRIPLRNIRGVRDDNTLILVTQSKSIPIWGLSESSKKSVLEILWRQRNIAPAHRRLLPNAAAIVRKHKRRAVIFACAFVLSILLVIPFLAGNPLHEYWEWAKYLLFLCLATLCLFAGQSGFAFSLQQDFKQSLRAEQRDREVIHKSESIP